jgi:hypothetical protein
MHRDIARLYNAGMNTMTLMDELADSLTRSMPITCAAGGGWWRRLKAPGYG